MLDEYCVWLWCSVVEESKRWLLSRKTGPGAGKASTAEMLLASTIAGKSPIYLNLARNSIMLTDWRYTYS